MYRLLSYEKKKGFGIFISRKDFGKTIYFFTSTKIYLPVSASVSARAPLILPFALQVKVSLLAAKKKRGPVIGCSSELLDDNCIRVFLYEGYLVNFEICVCFWCITCVGSRDQTRWSLLVENGGQNGNVCGPSCNKHKIYNPHKVEEQT